MDQITPDVPTMNPTRLQARRHALVAEVVGKTETPMRRKFALRFALPAVAVVTAVAAAVVLLIPEPSAYASWTAEPQSTSPAIAASSVEDCRARIAEMPTASQFTMPTDGVLTEQRGEITTVVLASKDSFGVCLRTPHQTLTGIGDTVDLGADSMQVVALPGMRSGNEPARVFLARVSPVVSTARIDTTDGRHVTATVNQGWCVAWWPSGADASRITLNDQAGNLIESIDQPTVAPVPAPTTSR